jgi:flagellar hook protein FlgE
MIRSLNTAVLGVKQFQTAMDAIGNNLANINTIAYKSARVDFSDTLAQTLRAPTPDTGVVSGMAGMQLGNGVKVSGIKNEFTQGAIKQTGVKTDMAVTGDGFFVVKDPISEEYFVTRAGDFRTDSDGFLVTNEGKRVQGLNQLAPAYDNKTTLGDIKLDKGKYALDKELLASAIGHSGSTADGKTASFSASTGVNPTTDIFTTSVAHNYATSGMAISFGVLADTGEALMPSGLSTGGTYYVKVLSTTTYELYTDSAMTAASKVDISATGNGDVYDATIMINAHGYTNGNEVKLGSGTTLPIASPALSSARSYFVRRLDDNHFTLHLTAAGAAAGSTPVVIKEPGTTAQMLVPGAEISTVSIGADGAINMLLTDGTQYERGQLMLQKFSNPNALLKEGSNLYGNWASAGALGSSSGVSIDKTALLKNSLEPGSGGLGRIASGALELSNVDMAREFSKMITTQRALQANARMITTSDEILKEMMALKR